MKKYSFLILIAVAVVILGFATKPEREVVPTEVAATPEKEANTNQQGYLETNNAKW